MKKKYTVSKRGFTLIELVLSVGILLILIGVLSSILGSILDVQLESKATSSVDQDGRYILARLIYDMKTLNITDSIVTPSNPGQQTTSLQIMVNSVNYTYSLDSNNNIQVINNSTNEINVLNSYDSTISDLSFQRIGIGGNNDTIRVTYTVTSKTHRTSGSEIRSFQTTLARQ